MSVDEWGNVVSTLLGILFVALLITALVRRKWQFAYYLGITAYIFLWPVKLWFWQFQLTGRATAPASYIWNGAVIQITLLGIVPLIASCFFRRFRPVLTALQLAYVFSLLLQLFSYIYWTYGTTKNFSASLSHLDSLYFAIGTLTTAGTGNISAISETARSIQALQMIIDLLLVGIVLALVMARYSNLSAKAEPVGIIPSPVQYECGGLSPASTGSSSLTSRHGSLLSMAAAAVGIALYVRLRRRD